MAALILLIAALLSPVTGCDVTVYEDGSAVRYCGHMEAGTWPADTFPAWTPVNVQPA